MVCKTYKPMYQFYIYFFLFFDFCLGKSWGDKIKELRAEMSSNDATAVIVYKLDEVACK